MATTQQSNGKWQYYCEKCGAQKYDFPTRDGAWLSLRRHMVDSHNNG